MRTKAELEFGLVDVTAREDATLNVNYREGWVNIYDIHKDDKSYGKHTTFEGGGFVLDGTWTLFPDTPPANTMGWWSSTLSDMNGNFTTKPTLTVSFSAVHTSGGVTLWFSDLTEEWATEVTITWYNASGAAMSVKTYRPNRARFFCENQIENYKGLKLEFASVNLPYHRLKLSAIEYGMIQTFRETDDEIISADILEQVDILSDVVSINTLGFQFHSAGNTFDLLNPKGAHVLFQQKQWVRASAIIDGTTLDMGTFYLEEVSTTDNITRMTCEDMLGVIDKTDFAGGTYTNVTAQVLIAAIMQSAKVTGYVLDTRLRTKRLNGTMAVMSHREALQQVAFALMAIVHCKRDGKIYIEPLPAATSGIVSTDNKVAGQTVKQADLVTAVEVYLGATSDDNLIGSYYASNLPAQAKANVLRVYLTLYSDGAALAKHIYTVSQLRLTASGEWFPVTIPSGALADVMQDSGNTLRGYITLFEVSLTDGFIAKTEVVGNAKSKFNI